jgi:hypothetical protein
VYHVTSDVDIVVYAFLPINNVYSNDATLVLPVPALGNKYQVSNYSGSTPAPYFGGSMFRVVAVEDGTVVNTFDRMGTMVDTNVILNKGELFQRATTDLSLIFMA